MRGSPKADCKTKVHAVPACEHDGVSMPCLGCLDNQNLDNGEGDRSAALSPVNKMI